MKMPKNHHETGFSFDVFSDYQVHIIFTDDINQSVAYIMARDGFNTDVPPNKLTDGLAVSVNNGHSYVLLMNAAPVAGTIAHEAWHVIRAMFKHMGVEFDDEAVAYHLGYTVQRIVDFKVKLDRRKHGNGRRRSAAANARRNRRSRITTEQKIRHASEIWDTDPAKALAL
jgi:hypothetical protein